MPPMQSHQAMALGTTSLMPVALVFKHWYLALQTWTLPPMDDMNTVMAHAALIVWCVAFVAARRGIQLPPLGGRSTGGGASSAS